MKLNRNFVRNLQQAIDLSQEEPSYEVEAIIYGYTPGVISRSEYTRVVNGLEGLKLRKTIEPQRLDIRTETRRGGLGNQRQSIREVDAISDYCKSGRIETTIEEGHVEIIRKSIVRRTPTITNLPIQVKDYRFRVNIKTEDTLEPENDIVKEELRNWGTALKFFRLIRRVSFHYGNWRIDCSQVRMTPTHNGAPALAVDVISSGVLNQSLRYEVEIEHVWEEGKGERNSEKDLKDLIKLITIIRRRITNNYFISSAKTEQNVIRSLRELTGVGIFPGPMPITLEPVHLDPSAGGGIQTDYVVTEKADGERKLLMFDSAGDGYFIDRSRTVFAAGLRGPANSLLDGESIVTDAGELFYLVFDTQWTGNRGVWDKPLLGGKDSRIEHGKQLIAAIEQLNPVQSPRVFMKDFAVATARGGIWAAAKRILGRTYPQRTDGLIYTPAKWAVQQERTEDGAPARFKAGTWRATMKWKPTTDQTVDFLIRRIKGAKKQALDSVTGRSGYFTSYTLNVLDPLGGADIRETLLTGEQEPKDKDKVVEFHPVTPVNPQASLMQVVDDDDSEPKTEEGELLEDQMIVECRYDVDAKPGWGWRPMRIRHEKTAAYRTGRISGTLNSAEVAESIWQQIHLPITENLITTGEGLEDFLAEAEELNNDGQKQQNRNMRRDELRTKKMSEFHNVIVKRRIVFKTFGRNTGGDAGSSPTFIDVACGKGGDLMKQKETGATFVLGVDIVPDNILNKKDGAVARYLKLRANPRKRDMAPDCIFAISDGASNFAEGDGAGDETSRTILRKLFGTEPVSAGTPALLRKQGGVLKSGAAGASCMFALHQFFKNSATADRFFGNIARGLRSGGLFAATLFDGDLVERSLDAEGVLERRDARTDDLIWRIERVEDDGGSAGGHFGRKIRVYIDSINTHQVEYLVSQDHLIETAGKHGLRPLSGEEATALGLPGTTELFQDTYARMRSQGVKVPDLSEPERVYSFLNRWVFLKKE